MRSLCVEEIKQYHIIMVKDHAKIYTCQTILSRLVTADSQKLSRFSDADTWYIVAFRDQSKSYLLYEIKERTALHDPMLMGVKSKPGETLPYIHPHS